MDEFLGVLWWVSQSICSKGRVKSSEPTASIERNDGPEKVYPSTLTSKRAQQKKLARQRRLELRPGSSSAHGQVLSNAFLTSAIGMLGQKFLYMIRCHYDGGWQVRPLTVAALTAECRSSPRLSGRGPARSRCSSGLHQGTGRINNALRRQERASLRHGPVWQSHHGGQSSRTAALVRPTTRFRRPSRYL